jgi:hypothetical protein
MFDPESDYNVKSTNTKYDMKMFDQHKKSQIFKQNGLTRYFYAKSI